MTRRSKKVGKEEKERHKERTLNMALCFVLLTFFALHSTLSFSHHVVFEEIGEMAGALSHIHAVVPVNISGLTHAVVNFQKDILHFQETYKCRKQPIGNQFDYNKHFHLRVHNLFNLAIADADDILQTVVSLQSLLSQVAVSDTPPLSAHEFRIKKRSPFAIVNGIVGTLMGWFKHQHLNSRKTN
jgi:hypothetical protein